MENKKNNKNIKLSIIVALLFVFALYFIGNTYARYSGDYNGTSSLSIAEWAVKLDGKSGEEAKNFTLGFEIENNSEYVVNNKLAPAGKAVAGVNVGLEGTEVAVDVIVETGDDFESKLTELGLSEEEVKFSVKQSSSSLTAEGTGSSEDPFVIKLQQGAQFGQEDVFKVEITVQWDNQEKNNSTDTQAGEKHQTLNLPVKVTVRQHIEAGAGA